MSVMPYHIPALQNQCIEALNIKANGVYVDCTLGGGGHTRAILAAMEAAGEGVLPGRLIAFDQDIDAINRALADVSLADNQALTLVHGNFRWLRNYLRFEGVDKVDGLLADLGVSFHHFDEAERGFSFRAEGPLDMRMNQQASHTAADLLARASADEIASWLWLYGELRQSRRMAAQIVKARTKAPIDTTAQLLQVIEPFINPRQQKKELAQVFQALRIVVNDEIQALRSLLEQTVEVLRPGARVAIITYHSLEDRLVKNFLKTGNLEGRDERDFFGRSQSPFKLLTGKPIVPDAAEVEANPRSRSAKLRVAQRL